MSAVDDDFFRLVAAARRPDRLFAVRSNRHEMFYAGSLPDGVQALVGRWYSERIVVLLFSPTGILHDIRRARLPASLVSRDDPNEDVDEEEFHAFLLAEYGFQPGKICIESFCVEDDSCGFWVGPLPWHFNRTLEEVLTAPEKRTDSRWAEDCALIRAFLLRGHHVIDWANDWRFLDADGRDAG